MKEIILGEIIKPHGLNGAVKVRSFADSPESFVRPTRLFMVSADGNRLEISIRDANPMGRLVTLKIEGIHTREQAEDLVGNRIVINREDLPDAQEDEYYWQDLIGMSVYDSAGTYYGIITSILPTGANDVFVVEGTNGEEILIPGTFEAVLEVNIPERRMVIEPSFGPVFHDTH
ncbi:MAG: 16S rRNA processing protein RimM [Deltaproteobacteria bacterium]|nr:16S rRNA processing protein RimM [Candidatus Zymogenaceae bacterium]